MKGSARHGKPFIGLGTDQERAGTATPEQVRVWVCLDLGKEEHFAAVLHDDSERLFARSVINDKAALDPVGRGRPAMACRSW